MEYPKQINHLSFSVIGKVPLIIWIKEEMKKLSLSNCLYICCKTDIFKWPLYCVL